MKHILLLIFSFFTLLSTSCTSQNKKQKHLNNSKITSNNLKIEKIELTEQTRGTNRVITFTPNSKMISLNGDISTFPLSPKEWETISVQANLLDLSKISSYESPTTARFSDGALASSISIMSEGKKFTSNSFDEKMPPKELEALYNLLKKDNINKKDSKPFLH